ncbi:hypothetical protein [Halapricum desulfuricans]|uniref:Putative membrane protein n=1 Tax=Halapricum desulfuricans TaxID=2841257 RepID=A0A897NGX9_9EURY|nr:hypothetical protein [Halapricum desulfuricans]QSG10194.1 putative membrane protein [Halapricum desulfuricans]QSG10705.1 putative membrane protein [Halapricum desulfuricans]
MPSSTPFIDRETGTFDFEQIWREAYPILGLVLLFGILGLLPLYLGAAVTAATGFSSLIGTALTWLGQLILAVGSGIVLMYVIVRAIQLA